MQRVKPGPGHMASYITPVFICDTCDEDARKALKKCRIYKSFHFSLHGWMDHHTAVVQVSTGQCKIADKYTKGLNNSKIKLPKLAEGASCVWHQYVITCDERDRLIDYLNEKVDDKDEMVKCFLIYLKHY